MKITKRLVYRTAAEILRNDLNDEVEFSCLAVSEAVKSFGYRRSSSFQKWKNAYADEMKPEGSSRFDIWILAKTAEERKDLRISALKAFASGDKARIAKVKEKIQKNWDFVKKNRISGWI